MTRRDTEHFGSLDRLQIALDTTLKDFEAVDFFHDEHPGVMYRHKKPLIRKSESLSSQAALKL
ncbi:hypothetical protein BN1200_540024 [Klebsiella variicola]|uniref:hypothetical protein n=1 Tax=Klebsiella variicola TaxID=244366 RepID=UPI0006281DF4|nr:hypothetical protein [Klebsiella variicola]CTQ02303.1 hypothetical protein BN1200_1070005 [Klebsiella variicola]CTQ15338.1 hypothetical protein BN1200_540024 [Klebsiella variicola]